MLDIRERLRLKLCKEIAGCIACDFFTANKIVNNLWSAYERALEKDPSIEEAVTRGEYEIIPRS